MNLQYFDNAEFQRGLKLSTLGNENAQAQRLDVYKGAMGNLDTLRDIVAKLKMFDANIDPLNAVENTAPSAMGVALAEATLKAQINSIVGYVAIERSMSQMTQMLVYRDVITKRGASVMPMIGPDNPRGRAGQKYQGSVVAGNTNITIELGNKIVGGQVSISLKLGDKTYPMMDDRKGNLLAPGGVINSGKVNYETGSIEIVLTTAAPADSAIEICYVLDKTYPMMDDRKGNLLAPGGVINSGKVNYETGSIEIVLTTAAPADSAIEICYVLDKTVGQDGNRTTIKQGYFEIKAKINKFEFEADLITAMISQKTVGGDIVADLQQSVMDEQILSINDQLVDTLRRNYTGTTMSIDLSAFSIQGGFFDSMMKVFNAGLASVDNAIAERCYKAVNANAYIIGNGLATLFQSLEDAQGWVPNNTGYVNGVIGFYKGRAVIRHLHLDKFEGYAVHKTPNGQLAPLGYGILLPVTNLPLVGNFANTNEVASGIYSVDGTNTVAMDLAQRFTVSMPADWMVLENA